MVISFQWINLYVNSVWALNMFLYLHIRTLGKHSSFPSIYIFSHFEVGFTWISERRFKIFKLEMIFLKNLINYFLCFSIILNNIFYNIILFLILNILQNLRFITFCSVNTLDFIYLKVLILSFIIQYKPMTNIFYVLKSFLIIKP